MRSRQTTLWLLCLSASDAFLLPPKSISTSLHNSLNDENYDISNAHFVKKQPQHKQVQLQPGIIGVVPANKDDKNKNNNNNHEASRSPPPSEPLLDDVTMKLRNGKTQSQSEKESHATPQISQFHAPKKYKQIRTFSGGYQLVEDKTPTTPVQKPSSNTSWRSGAFSTSVNLNPAITTAQSLPQRQTPIKPASPLSISPVTQHQTPPKRAEFVNSWRSQAISSPTPKNRLKTLGEEPLDRNAALGMEVPIKAKKSNILRENNADQRMQHPVADKVIGRSKRLTPIGDPKEPLDKNAIQGLQVPIKAKYAEPKYSMPTKLTASPIDGSKVLDKNVIQGLQVELEAADSSLNEDSPLQAKVDLPGKPKHLLDKDTIQGPRVEIRTQSVPGANASLTARAAADEEADPKHSLGKSAIQGQDVPLKAPKANLWALAARSQAAKEILASQNLQKSSVVKTPSKSTEIKSNTNQTPIREPHLHSNLYKTQGTTDDKTFSEFISNTTSSSSLSDADEMSEKTSVETSDIPTMPKFQQVKTASGFKMIDYLEYMDDLRPKFRVTRVDYPETWLRPGATMQTDDTTQHFVSTSTEGEETISNRTVLDRQKMLRQDISRTGSTISNKIELSAPQSLAEVNKTASNMTKLMDQPLPLQSKLMTPKIKQVRTPAGFQMVTAGEDDMTELVVKRVDYPETWKKDITSRATNVKLVQVQTDAGFEMIEAPEDHTEQNVSAPIGLKRADYPETWQKPISNGNTKAYTSGLTENKASIGTSVPIHAPGKGTLIPKKYKKVKTFSGGFEFVEDDGIDQPSLTKPKPTNLKVKQVQTPAGFQMVTFDNENEPETQDAYSSVRRADYPETWQRSTSTKANEGVNVNALKNPAAEGLSVPVQAPARVSEWSRDDKVSKDEPEI